MKINVNQNNIKYILNDNATKSIDLGYEDIHNHGFQVVDHILDILIPEINDKDVVTVYGENIESKMIARKIEDKIKREVIMLSGENKESAVFA
jgi:hypothetical protein